MPWCASTPHHITSVFLPIYTSKPSTTGSIGMGLAVEPRLGACLEGPRKDYPTDTAERVPRLLGVESPGILFKTPLPPARGYAVSAATALATALLIAQYLGGKGVLEALAIAHRAEVLEKTGLGDVLALSCGIGVVYRLQAGEPGIGKATCKQLPNSIAVIGVESRSPMHTSMLLTAVESDRIRELARMRLKRAFEDLSPHSFIEESMKFTLETGAHKIALGATNAYLLQRTPGLIGFYSKKMVTILFVESDMYIDALEHVKTLKGVNARVLEPSEYGPRIWWR